MTKHYVGILYPGSLFTETSVREVENRELIDLPKGAFGFQFFDVEEVEVDGELLTGEPKNESGIYYAGTLMTLDEVEKECGSDSFLVRNMRANDWEKVVKTVCGNFQPFTEKDHLLK